MLFPSDRSVYGVYSKWLSIAAVGATPILLVVAVAKQSLHALFFSLGVMVFIPVMAVAGYGMSVVCRLFFIAHLDDDQPSDLFPHSWPFPFTLFNWQHRFLNQTDIRRFAAQIQLALINAFDIAWSCFLVICVVGAIIEMYRQ